MFVYGCKTEVVFNPPSEGGPMTTHTPGVGKQAHPLAAGPAGAMLADIMAAFAAEQAHLGAVGAPGVVAGPGNSNPVRELLHVHRTPPARAQVRAGQAAEGVV